MSKNGRDTLSCKLFARTMFVSSHVKAGISNLFNRDHPRDELGGFEKCSEDNKFFVNITSKIVLEQARLDYRLAIEK